MSSTEFLPPRSSLSSDEITSHQSLLEENEYYAHGGQPKSSRRSLLNYGHLAMIQVVLLSLYTWTFLVLGEKYFGRSHGPDLIYSPARSVMTYETVDFSESLKDNLYTGPPSPEGDAAWRKLLSYANIRVSKKEMNILNITSIPVPNEEGQYLAFLGVFHQLHCLSEIRRATWLDYYNPGLEGEAWQRKREHTDHCIDMLRQAIQCHGDTSIKPFHWPEEQKYANSDPPHECVNFEALKQWSAERVLDDSILPVLWGQFHGGDFPNIGS